MARAHIIGCTVVPSIFNPSPTTYQGMSVNITGYNLYTEEMRDGIYAQGVYQCEDAVGPQEWSITPRMYVERADLAAKRMSKYLCVDEVVTTTAPEYRLIIMRDGLRLAKAKYPKLTILVFVVTGLPQQVIDLVKEGTVEYLGIECYTVTHPQFTVPGRSWDERRKLLDDCVAAGVGDAAIPIIGHLTAGPTYWGESFTPKSVKDLVRLARQQYPQSPGIGYWVPHKETDSVANRAVIRAFAEEARAQFPNAVRVPKVEDGLRDSTEAPEPLSALVRRLRDHGLSKQITVIRDPSGWIVEAPDIKTALPTMATTRPGTWHRVKAADLPSNIVGGFVRREEIE